MSNVLRASIRELQTGESESAQQAFGRLKTLASRDSEELAAELSRVVIAEHAAGGLRTPRLLTLLGLTRVPSPECLEVSLSVLRGLGSAQVRLPTDAVLGAAAIIALSRPRALLPDIAAFQANPNAAEGIDRDVVSAIPELLAISNEWLGQAGTSAVADMARWLWRDCADCDPRTLADFVGMYVEKLGCEAPIVGLFVDLLEQLTASADAKRYAGECLGGAGASDAVIKRLKLAWCATLVLPERGAADPEPAPTGNPEPQPPDPRVDEALAMFSEGDQQLVEIARVMLDEMFEEPQPSAALVYWSIVTVDALSEERRRRTDIDWALRALGTVGHRHPGRLLHVPPSILQRWLETPQLLSATTTYISLELLSRLQPGLVVRRYLHRAIAVSDERHSAILFGDLWRRIVRADPCAVFSIVGRWFAFGFDRCDLTDMLLELLTTETQTNPHLVADLERSLPQSPSSPAAVVEVAHKLLEQLRDVQHKGN